MKKKRQYHGKPVSGRPVMRTQKNINTTFDTAIDTAIATNATTLASVYNQLKLHKSDFRYYANKFGNEIQTKFWVLKSILNDNKTVAV